MEPNDFRQNGEETAVDQKALELQENFTYDGYQVVRRELFAHLREPSVVIRRDSITFNTACIAGMEDAVYIQILVNPDTKKMVVRKCDENDKDALRWCIAKTDKRKSRKVTSKIFSAKMYELMGWNTACRYKILGHKIVYEDEMLYIFDLLETEIFLDVRKTETQKAGVQAGASKGTENAQKMIMEGIDLTSHGDHPPVSMRERKAYYPADWRDSFGLPVEEHSRTLQIDIKDGYAEFNVFSDHKGDSTPSSVRRADE